VKNVTNCKINIKEKVRFVGTLQKLKNQRMKKLLLFTFLSAFMVNLSLIQAAGNMNDKSTKKNPVKVEKQQAKLSDAEVQVLLARLDEIKSMDLKSLTVKEKKDLRKEVRDIRDKLSMNSDGFSIYIGGGALIVIIILLILLL
jgi:hypothetical protein